MTRRKNNNPGSNDRPVDARFGGDAAVCRRIRQIA
jgi:hypothetical protein